jgi:hypothetical protein
MKVHLANECLQCPEEISRYLYERVANRQTNYTRNSVLMSSLPVTSLLQLLLTMLLIVELQSKIFSKHIHIYGMYAVQVMQST